MKKITLPSTLSLLFSPISLPLCLIICLAGLFLLIGSPISFLHAADHPIEEGRVGGVYEVAGALQPSELAALDPFDLLLSLEDQISCPTYPFDPNLSHESLNVPLSSSHISYAASHQGDLYPFMLSRQDPALLERVPTLEPLSLVAFSFPASCSLSALSSLTLPCHSISPDPHPLFTSTSSIQNQEREELITQPSFYLSLPKEISKIRSPESISSLAEENGLMHASLPIPPLRDPPPLQAPFWEENNRSSSECYVPTLNLIVELDLPISRDHFSNPSWLDDAQKREQSLHGIEYPKHLLTLEVLDSHQLLEKEPFYERNLCDPFSSSLLSEIPHPTELNVATFEDNFEGTIYYSKDEKDGGYYFTLNVDPKEASFLSSPMQNVIFVLDGSSNVSHRQFNAFKASVGKALSYMKHGDNFNILVCNGRARALSQDPFPLDDQTRNSALLFLKELNRNAVGKNFHPEELISMASELVDPDRENIIVLLTNGAVGVKEYSNHKKLQRIIKESKGTYSIFSAVSGGDKAMPELSLLSTLNRGKLIHSPTDAALPRNVAKLIKELKELVASEIRLYGKPSSPGSSITFLPGDSMLSPLYGNRPYMIYGKSKQLSDFDLILQGRSGNSWIHIKKTVRLSEAKKAPPKVMQLISLQKSYHRWNSSTERKSGSVLQDGILESHKASAQKR